MAEDIIPALHEHQNAKELGTSSPQGYEPTDEEKKAIRLVNSLFEKAKNHRKKYDQRWLDYYKMFRGKQWKEQRPSYRHSEVINMIFQHIQSVVPILTDARQRFEFLPEEPGDTELAEILDQVAEADWQRGNWTYKLAEILYEGHFYGTGLGSIEYNPKARLGTGAIEFHSKDPFYSFPDPDATDVNEKANFFIYAEPVSISKMKRDYPEKAAFLKPDLIDFMGGSKTDQDVTRFRSPVDSRSVFEGTSAYDLAAGDQCLKITCFVKDEEIIEEEKKSANPDGSEQIEYLRKLKYPNGRKICMAGGVILSDGPAPDEDGLFPYFRYANYIDPRSFWGISEIEQLESPQKIFNKLVSFALDVLTLMGNPVWVVDDSSGVDTDNLFNRPGLVVEKTKGSEVRREEGVQLQPYVLQLVDRMRNWFDETGGSQDVSRGARPEGITAASAISQLQEAAQTRIRQKSRNLDAALQCAGQLYKNRLFQYTPAPRVIRVTNNPNAQKFFKFHVEQIDNGDGTTRKVAKVRDYVQNPQTGQWSESLEERVFEMRGDFDVRVSTGSALPFAKDQKFGRARQMFLDGVIDEEEYLKAADYPNWESVLQRVQQKRAEQAQAAAAANGAAAPPAPQGAAVPA